LLALISIACGTVPAEPLEITVLSYNIKRGLGNDGIADLSRAAGLVNRLQPDLVALQEIDNGVERSGQIDQMAELERLTGLHARFGMFMPYQGGEYGIGLLSRFPILASANHVLPEGREPRTALDARVQLPDGDELILCSIHFYATEEERLAQAETVVELYRDLETPMILAGDFNSRPGSVVMELIEGHWVNTDKGEDRFTMSATNPRSEIDFILYRPADRFEVVSIDVLDEPVISDHRPVLMVLRLLPARD
jgi:endonuclease/exonuclease/phosphatase family metal-dependent hydrolase